ncbi:hypothetical protein ACWCV2_22815 [Streptomyces pseudogriseolus]
MRRPFLFLLAAMSAGSSIEHATHGRWTTAALAVAVAVCLAAESTKERRR